MPDPMRPDDVPGDLVRKFFDICDLCHHFDLERDEIAKGLADVLPEHERQVRAEDAEEPARYQELLRALWLYVDWRYVTKQLTTEQKELWANAVEADRDPEAQVTADRWWRA